MTLGAYDTHWPPEDNPVDELMENYKAQEETQCVSCSTLNE